MNRKEHLLKILQGLLTLGSLSGAGWFVYKAFSLNASVLILISYFLCALPLMFIFAKCVVHFYLPSMADSFAFGLLMPRRHLDKAPLLLTPIECLIASGELFEAERALLELLEKHPTRPEIIALLVRIYDKQNLSEKLWPLLGRFADNPNRPVSPLNLKIAMRYADLLFASGEYAAMHAFLKSELNLPCYSKIEKSALSNRLDFSENQLRKVSAE